MNKPNLDSIIGEFTGRTYDLKKENGIYVLREPKEPGFFNKAQIKAISIIAAAFYSFVSLGACTTALKGRPVIEEPQQRRVYTDIETKTIEELTQEYGQPINPNTTEEIVIEIFSKAFPNLVNEFKPTLYTIEGTHNITKEDAYLQTFQENAIPDCVKISGGRLLTEKELIKYGMKNEEAKELIERVMEAMKNNANIDEIIGASSYRGGVLAYVGKIEGEHAFVAIPYSTKGFLGNALANSARNILANQLNGKHYPQVQLHTINQDEKQVGEMELYSFIDNNSFSYWKLDPSNSSYNINVVSFSGEELEKLIQDPKDRDSLSHFTARTGLLGKMWDWIVNDDKLLGYASKSEFKPPFKEFNRGDLTYVFSGAGPNKFRYAAVIPGSNEEPIVLGIFDIYGKDLIVSPPPNLLTVNQPYHGTKAFFGKVGTVAAAAGLILLGNKLGSEKKVVEYLIPSPPGGQTGGGGILGGQ